MYQLLQSLKTGETIIEDIPTPVVGKGQLLIKSQCSVVSAGTERTLVDFGKSNYLQKARQQPEKVREVLNKIKTDGLQPTIEAVRTKLDDPITLGYSNAGVVLEVGKGVKNFKVGDRVISNGPHAEYVRVPENLCAKIPDNVDFEKASFTVISSIGLQGIRLAKPTLGETFVVIGLGLVGQLTVQLLKAHGCNVIATDLDENKVNIAKQFGVDAINVSEGVNPIEYVDTITKGRGADGVIVTASTASSDPVSQAANMSRKRGRIIMVGVTGLELNRTEFYEKELTFQVSCSYGPGRYDSEYEDKGHDYPISYVRWTEQRNFEAVLNIMSQGKLDIQSLITKKFNFRDAPKAYKTLSNDKNAIGLILQYPKRETSVIDRTIELKKANVQKTNLINLGIIGAGNYTNRTLLPAIKNSNNINLKTIVSSGGINGFHVGKRFHFEKTTTDSAEVFLDSEINSVIVTTRHDTHAQYVKKAIQARKHVFVEKPLCLTYEELDELKSLDYTDQLLMVGFNRRFSPHITKMKELLGTTTKPKTMVMVVNAGFIPADHWTQDPEIGGGRIIGEACHFIDLLRFIADSPISNVQAVTINDPSENINEDNSSITLTFEDGSIGTIHYFANGHKSFPKERLEVFVEGKILSLDNFKVMRGYGWPNFKRMRCRQDKGHENGLKAFIEGIESGQAPIALDEVFEVTKASLDVVYQINNI